MSVSARLFAGPEEERLLEGIAPGLELVKDYGWVTIIAKPLFWLLEKIHSYVGNWGWSIVIQTLIITLELLPLVPAGKVIVSESGLHQRDQLDDLARHGVDAVLVGEALMRSLDIEAACRALTAPAQGSSAAR